MGSFVIDADTRGAWKSVGDTGCRASSVASEYLSTHGVEFAGGCAGSDGLHHGLAGFGDDTTSTKERIEILLLVNRHSGILLLIVTISPGELAPSQVRPGPLPRSTSPLRCGRRHIRLVHPSLFRQRSERRGMATLRSILVGRGEL